MALFKRAPSPNDHGQPPAPALIIGRDELAPILLALDNRRLEWRLAAALGVPLAVFLVVIFATAGSEDPTDNLRDLPPAVEIPSTAEPWQEQPPSGRPAGSVRVMVERVIDGDTIEVSLAAERFTVRYIGVDTPETVAPGQPIECFGREASMKNSQLVAARIVYLEKDVSETDRFGRLLRYVYLEDGAMVNELLVLEGFAQVATFPPDVKYQDRFLAAQRAARDAGRGLWTGCQLLTPTMPIPSTAVPQVAQPTSPPAPAAVQPTPVPTAVPVVVQPTSPPAQSNCDPSYPTVCIPPYPPDLDCGQITFRRFTVLPPDPHGFDGNDNDGIGCET